MKTSRSLCSRSDTQVNTWVTVYPILVFQEDLPSVGHYMVQSMAAKNLSRWTGHPPVLWPEWPPHPFLLLFSDSLVSHDYPLDKKSTCLCVRACTYTPLSWKVILQMCACLLNCSDMSDSLWPIGCIPPGSSVHEILQARILEWFAMPCSRRSPWPRDQTWDSCIAGRFFTTKPQRKPSPTPFVRKATFL